MIEGCASASPLERAAAIRSRRGLVFFDSANGSGGAHSVSIIACEPERIFAGDIGRDWGVVERALEAEAMGEPDDRFSGGMLAGWVGYDGRFMLGLYREVWIYDHRADAWLCGAPPQGGEGNTEAVEVPLWKAGMDRASFEAMVHRAKAYIAAGDIYQVNLSHRFSAPYAGDPWDFYRCLRRVSPAPFGAFLDLGGTAVLSASPESFLSMSGRNIETRPIKGTRPRMEEAAADERSAMELLTSPKEIAELVMITDLERNDLGQVCEYGSVMVPEMLRLERFAQVFHLVSTVRGRLREGVSHAEAFRACFPGGSITGAPKKRAREIIAELEPVPRGIYTGAIGWFGFNGESRWSIAIRTAIHAGDELAFHVGAGIVADSDPAAEYEETLHKARGFFEAASFAPSLRGSGRGGILRR